jgi:hypothetical protein
MTFAQELTRYISLGMTLQYIENRNSWGTGNVPEPPVYYKRTHGQRSEDRQSLWGDHVFSLRT